MLSELLMSGAKLSRCPIRGRKQISPWKPASISHCSVQGDRLPANGAAAIVHVHRAAVNQSVPSANQATFKNMPVAWVTVLQRPDGQKHLHGERRRSRMQRAHNLPSVENTPAGQVWCPACAREKSSLRGQQASDRPASSGSDSAAAVAMGYQARHPYDAKELSADTSNAHPPPPISPKTAGTPPCQPLHL